MWESEVDHIIEEDGHTLALFGLIKNEGPGRGVVVACEPPDYTLEFEGGHELRFICRCTDPVPVIEEIEARGGENPYLGFVAYVMATMRAFGIGEAPAHGLIINNVTGDR